MMNDLSVGQQAKAILPVSMKDDGEDKGMIEKWILRSQSFRPNLSSRENNGKETEQSI